MIYVLLERDENMINSVLDKMFSKVPVSCRQFITKKTAYEIIKSYKQPPLIASGWLLIASHNVTDSQIKLLSEIQGSTIVFKVDSKKVFYELIDRLTAMSIYFQFIDNYKLSKETIVKYISDSLPICESDAKYLAKRQKYYPRNVVSAVQMLKTFEKVDRGIIRKYTSVNDSIPLYEIFGYVFKLEECKLSYTDAVKLVYQYRFGFNHVLDYLIDTCELHLHIFNYMVNGEISIRNYKDFRADTMDKMIKNITEYELSKIVSRFEVISVEYLYFILQVVKGIPKDKTGIPDFINLLKAVA